MKKQHTADIYSLAFGGSGVCRIDGKVCFVKGALPGEKVILSVVRETTRYAEAVTEEILEISEERRTPLCRYYNVCGGCQLQHISYEKELACKREQVSEILARIGGQDSVRVEDIEPSVDCYNYRSGITLHRKKGKYGFYDISGKDIVPIEECCIAEKSINAALKERKMISDKDDITVKSDHTGRLWYSDRTGERFYIEKYGDTEMYLSPRSFSQSNRYIAMKIAEDLRGWISSSASGTAFFDAYCGAGFFTFLLRGDFILRSGMDSSRISIDCARSTIKRHALSGIKVYKGDVEKEFLNMFDNNKKGHNIVFVDPPRKGIERGFLEELSSRRDIDALYYLSCDVSRLARDSKIITGGREWKVNRVKPFDMFPRTRHIEVLAEFCRI